MCSRMCRSFHNVRGPSLGKLRTKSQPQSAIMAQNWRTGSVALLGKTVRTKNLWLLCLRIHTYMMSWLSCLQTCLRRATAFVLPELPTVIVLSFCTAQLFCCLCCRAYGLPEDLFRAQNVLGSVREQVGLRT